MLHSSSLLRVSPNSLSRVFPWGHHMRWCQISHAKLGLETPNPLTHLSPHLLGTKPGLHLPYEMKLATTSLQWGCCNIENIDWPYIPNLLDFHQRILEIPTSWTRHKQYCRTRIGVCILSDSLRWKTLRTLIQETQFL